jgi:ABC-type nickel/cobalt efflux system permease component RcnA
MNDSTARKKNLLRPSLLASCLLLASSVSFAHPMGNFSTSHYSGIRVENGFVEIRYLIDMAEIPTFQEIQQNSLIAKPEDAGTQSYVAKQGEVLQTGLVLTLNGQPLALRTESAEVIFPAGAGGLPTMKMSFLYRAAIPQLDQSGAQQVGASQTRPSQTRPGSDGELLYYRDNNFRSRIGWKEIIVTAGAGVTIVNASVPGQDRSSQLSNYPTDLLNSPPLDLEATVHLRWEPTSMALVGSAAAGSTAANYRLHSSKRTEPTHEHLHPLPSPQGTVAARTLAARANTEPQTSPASEPSLQPNRQTTPQNRFTQLMTSKQFGFGFLLLAAAIAAGLGALHALEPGHGKTIVAAYLVGSKGTAYHAFLLGMIVTVSHTASVYALGAITLYASRYIVPEQLYPWLGAISGLLIAALGSYLFLQRYAGHEIGHSHGPGGHHHHHNGYDHTHDDGYVHTDDALESQDEVSYRQLLALGVTGGIVPCPAALVVLLSAVALNRVGFGLFLIVAFSMGLAAVLIAVGVLMVYARRFMTRLRSEGPMIKRWLPLTSAAAITFLGLAIAVRSLVTAGILQIRV